LKVDSNVIYELIVKELGGKLDGINSSVASISNTLMSLDNTLRQASSNIENQLNAYNCNNARSKFDEICRTISFATDGVVDSAKSIQTSLETISSKMKQDGT